MYTDLSLKWGPSRCDDRDRPRRHGAGRVVPVGCFRIRVLHLRTYRASGAARADPVRGVDFTHGYQHSVEGATSWERVEDGPERNRLRAGTLLKVATELVAATHALQASLVCDGSRTAFLGFSLIDTA